MASITVGVTELAVHNVSRMKRFYTEGVGLQVLKETATEVHLGHGKTPIIALVQSPLHLAPHGSAGLYHNAILFSSRVDLAQVVNNLLETVPESFTGTANHLVSEAFYFEDPERNGLELYFDTPRSTWQWENGFIKMSSLYIDPHEYIERFTNQHETGTRQMGHVHLRVGDIEQAKEFYARLIGFDITAELPGALFLSTGGYHHHLGLNVWESIGAGLRTPSLGLSHVELLIANQTDFTDIKDRLANASLPYQQTSSNLFVVEDPWNNRVHIKNR